MIAYQLKYTIYRLMSNLRPGSANDNMVGGKPLNESCFDSCAVHTTTRYLTKINNFEQLCAMLSWGH